MARGWFRITCTARRSVFLVMGVLVAVIAVVSHVYLLALQGEKLSKGNSPLAVLKMPSILIVLLLTFLSVAAHYGIYTYITLLVEMIGFAGGIGVALLLFGVGSVISVMASAKYIDAYLRPLIVISLAVGGIAMAMFLAFKGTIVVSHVAFLLSCTRRRQACRAPCSTIAGRPYSPLCCRVTRNWPRRICCRRRD